MSKQVQTTATVENIGTLIRTIRGQKVILDSDLARIFSVPTFRFNEAVKRNRKRFGSLKPLTPTRYDGATHPLNITPASNAIKLGLLILFSRRGSKTILQNLLPSSNLQDFLDVFLYEKPKLQI